MDSQFGFLVSQIKQIGGRIFEKILSESKLQIEKKEKPNYTVA